MTTNRAGAICLLEILKEYSDADHILRMPDITSKLKNIYGITADRRSVYSAVELLRELGYDISDYSQNGEGYFLRGAEFDPTEVCVLIDSVYANTAIPASQTERLVRKLGKLTNVHHRRSYKHLSSIKPDKKSANKELFLNIEIIDEAITLGKKVTFTYLEYDFDKKLKPRREKKYTVSPFQMIVTNEHYYLLCKMWEDSEMSMYRLDRIKDVEISEYGMDAKFTEDELRNAREQSTYAWYGESELVTMRCQNHILGDVIDRFGRDITIEKEDDETFIAKIKTSPRGIRFWAMQYLPYVEVLTPESLRERIIDDVKNNPYWRKRYE